MWVDRKLFQDLVHERAEAVGRAQALRDHTIAQQAMMDWMRVRFTQLEHERAIMMEQYMGIKVPVPVIEQTAPKPDVNLADPVNLFADMGDEAAKREGVGWDEDGHITYSK